MNIGLLSLEIEYLINEIRVFVCINFGLVLYVYYVFVFYYFFLI